MPDKSPADELKDLKASLEANQAKDDELGRTIELQKGRIAELTKTVAEIEQKQKAWDKAAQDAADKRKEFDNYLKVKEPIVEAVVPEATRTELINAKVAAEYKVSELAKGVEAASAAVDAKAQAYAAAKAATASRQSEYTALTNLAAQNETRLKDLATLKADADKAAAANNMQRMYLLLVFIGDGLKRLQLPTSAEYLAQLNKAGSAVAAAGQAERASKDALDKANADRQQAQKDFDEAKAKWRQQLLDSIPDPKPAAAPA
jgi:hypothetical protein